MINAREKRALFELYKIAFELLSRTLGNNAHSPVREVLHLTRKSETARLALCKVAVHYYLNSSRNDRLEPFMHTSYVNRARRAEVTSKYSQYALRYLYAPLAQLVEQRIYTAKVGGSSPSGRTIERGPVVRASFVDIPRSLMVDAIYLSYDSRDEAWIETKRKSHA